MTEAYPYPHDVLVNTKHAWSSLAKLIAEDDARPEARKLRLALLLTPLGAKAGQYAESLILAAENEHLAELVDSLSDETAQMAVDKLADAGRALTRSLGMTSAAGAVGAPTPSAPPSVHGEQSAAADGAAGLAGPAAHPNLAQGGECSLDGCTRPKHARGWCVLHYDRWRETGSHALPDGEVACPTCGHRLPKRTKRQVEIEGNIARSVGVDINQVRELAEAVYGRDLLAEREARRPAGSNAATASHVTRQIVAELRQALTDSAPNLSEGGAGTDTGRSVPAQGDDDWAWWLRGRSL